MQIRSFPFLSNRKYFWSVLIEKLDKLDLWWRFITLNHSQSFIRAEMLKSVLEHCICEVISLKVKHWKCVSTDQTGCKSVIYWNHESEKGTDKPFTFLKRAVWRGICFSFSAHYQTDYCNDVSIINNITDFGSEKSTWDSVQPDTYQNKSTNVNKIIQLITPPNLQTLVATIKTGIVDC